MNMEAAKHFISDIRSKYGISENGAQDEKYAHISNSLKNAIEQLSVGLYEKEIHFILELIQNAEDNNYKDVTPELRFVLLDEDPTDTEGSDGCLCVFNNEVGFEEKNVDSICQIGESTKTKAEGYIGEKGIGFKSVFIVSAAPHIYSNSFRFQFKEKDSEIGLSYIVPYWLDEVPEIIRENQANTAILLPLKPGKKEEIQQKIKLIKPETILFLSKLEGLVVEISGDNTEVEWIKDKRRAPILELLVNSRSTEPEVFEYWVYTGNVEVPKSLNEEKRAEIQDRDITLAFPLNDNQSAGVIYAYLPTEVESGLPFLVNSDFLLTANRESIQSDRAWNIWLRDELSAQIVKALEGMSLDSKYREVLYRYIPMAGDLKTLKDYFKPVCDGVQKGLWDKNIILTDSGLMVRPAQARRVAKPIRNLFQAETRPQLLESVFFIDEKIEYFTNRLQSIGVGKLTPKEFRQCLSDTAWLANQSSDWFCELYSFLARADKGFTQWVETLPILLLQDGDLVASNKAQVYFPVENHAFLRLVEKYPNLDFPTIPFIDKKLFEFIYDNEKLRKWVETHLQIMEFSLGAYIEKNLVPWLVDNVKLFEEKDYLAAIEFILNCWPKILQEDYEEIGRRIPVLLDTGEILNRSDRGARELLFPRIYDKERGWQLLLTDESECAHVDVLSDKYLSIKIKKEDYLVEFINSLGAQTIPDFPTYSGRLSKYTDSQYKLYISSVADFFAGQSSTSTPQYSSWMPPLFFLERNFREKPKRRAALIHWLEEMLKHNPDALRAGTIDWFYYGPKEKAVESGLHFYLVNLPWIKTSQGIKRPSEIFVKSKQLSEMFGAKLAYLNDKISPELCEYLGIKTEVNTETVLDRLSDLSQEGNVDFGLVKKFYEYLDDHGVDYEKAFHERPLIYVPTQKKKWFLASEAIWEDSSDVLGELYGWLSTPYESVRFRKFFLQKLAVSETIDVENLFGALVGLPNRRDLSAEKIESALSQIYSRVVEHLKDSESVEDWLQEFAKETLIWSQAKEFFDSEDVYVPDDLFLRSMFSQHLEYVWKPKNLTHSEMEQFYRLFGIPFLSENVSAKLIDKGSISVQAESEFITDFSKRLLCYYLYNDSSDRFKEILDNGLLKSLLQSTEAQTDALSIKYSVEGAGVSETLRDRSAFWEPEERILYLREKADPDDLLDDIVEAIARALWGALYKRYEDTLRAILSVGSEDRFKKFRGKKGWNLPPAVKSEINVLIQSEWKENASDIYSIDEKPEEIADFPTIDEETGGSPSNANSAFSKPRVGVTSGSQIGKDKPAITQRPSTSGSVKPREPSGGEWERPAGDSRSNRSRSRGLASSVNSARRNQMRSHVAHEYSDQFESDKDSQSQEARNELGRQGELEVVDDLSAKGFLVTRMPPNNKGFDIKAVNPTTGEEIYIEVKGDSFGWSPKGVGITPAQYRFGQEKGESFYLAVVDNLRSSPRKIYYIQDPVSQITQFRFDDGWASLSTAIRSVSPEPAGTQKSVLEQLLSLTESDQCKEVIGYCNLNGYPFPEIGIELTGDGDEVVFENIELAWEQERVGILLSDADKVEAAQIDSRWRFFSIAELDIILVVLDSLFTTDQKCEG
jgi:hypothetical protein